MAENDGYAGKILRVDLSSGEITGIPTRDYSDGFLGGRGIAAKVYWDEVPPDVGPFDPGNRLLFFTGPLAGFPALAGSRWTVCGKSPITERESFSYCNLGGNWGVKLKFAGYDGIIVQGKSARPVYILVRDDAVQIKDASGLWGKGAAQTRGALKEEMGKSAAVVAIGPGGENMVSSAVLLAEQDASGSCGFGAVMGSKNLKAIAVMGSGSVKAAHPEGLREITNHIRSVRKYERQIMIWIAQPEGPAKMILTSELTPGMKWDFCYGCIQGCVRAVREISDGTRGKLLCESAVFYEPRARKYYGDPGDVPFHANRLCDDYGLDTQAVDGIMMWLARCSKAGILNDENTGLPLSQMGNLEFIETLVRKTALRDGFGDILAEGILKAAQIVGQGTDKMITDYVPKAGQPTTHGPRLYITNGILYATEPRPPIHLLHDVGLLIIQWLRWLNKEEGTYVSSSMVRDIAKRFWGGELAGDLSTYEGKALAAKKIQDRGYVKESLVLCDFYWPMQHFEASDDHLGDPTLESRILSAVTGKEVDEEGLYRIGERIFNLQRAIMVREGHRGREDDSLPEAYFTVPLKSYVANPECLVPGKNGEVISRRGEVVNRDKFEGMKTEFYRLRGWDADSGLQRREVMEEVGLSDVAGELKKIGALA
ncbi:aldehyde ferredoxin oxidoreductase family protein [Chloroflexota bacterium]